MAQSAANQPENTGANPFSFTISALGSFTCVTQHTGPTALRPIRRTKQLWLSALLKDTSVTTGIRTHALLLATPELEFGALDRSATTLRLDDYNNWHFSEFQSASQLLIPLVSGPIIMVPSQLVGERASLIGNHVGNAALQSQTNTSISFHVDGH